MVIRYGNSFVLNKDRKRCVYLLVCRRKDTCGMRVKLVPLATFTTKLGTLGSRQKTEGGRHIQLLNQIYFLCLECSWWRVTNTPLYMTLTPASSVFSFVFMFPQFRLLFHLRFLRLSQFLDHLVYIQRRCSVGNLKGSNLCLSNQIVVYVRLEVAVVLSCALLN